MPDFTVTVTALTTAAAAAHAESATSRRDDHLVRFQRHHPRDPPSSPHKAQAPQDHDELPVGRCCPRSTRRSTLSDIGPCLASLIRRRVVDSGDGDSKAEPLQLIWHKSTGTRLSALDDVLVAHGARSPSRHSAQAGALPEAPLLTLPFPSLEAKLPSSTTTTMTRFSGDAFAERTKAAAAQRDSYATPAHTAKKRTRHECDSLASAAPSDDERDEIPANSSLHSIHLALPLVYDRYNCREELREEAPAFSVTPELRPQGPLPPTLSHATLIPWSPN
ncbi:hypothetical protein GGX14DRAFT_577783 [Mycena pura]|uniref:Uncharacterized protein n=1 Tax=Mycena pura TaxID=153505 RepID=A0AAD6XZX9_9AGAR|nr:hypothetical protein GGX14DRAFT_577783 [Mycena pura]